MNAERLLELRRLRDDAELAYRQACLDVSREAQNLQCQGMSLTELGRVLGISKQAVSQLVKNADGADRREWEESQESKRWDSWADRKLAESERGLVRGSFPCESCGKFKRRPADECAHCGSTLLSHNGNAADLNRAYGYAA